ncbi:alpha/beta hydrolase [Novacetimonas hansenii]|uniref:Esterase n=2 Tax=Novacetimonas hansenii TaxID=436 RepID=A0ABQ0SIR1_NOVHA|nr:alpha/beta hydrolase [Novacetimonas hansenii]EFG84889.1 hypothetical protein GXY_06093 [Novacetimonas hansenii ATCC 23769]GAN82536.1 hypothetical protein Gaha_0019_008 [Novacetimonas hansenii JCM 7643]GBQ60684.1 hypothetical protein AA0243_2409 [Novacetimonas hansenii NRIC 0243]GEC65169.1 esterase [Novacetimonas hansenii]
MKTFVLVPGAWHGSWCWKRVRAALTRLGHAVFTPSLTGLGERSHQLSPEVDLETHIDDVANLIRWEDLSDVVLVGHSYGGCIISGVADLMADRISALVYLDAFILEDGQSLHDTLPEEARQGQLDVAVAVGDGWRLPPIPAAVFNVNAADREWVDAKCTAQPLASFRQKLRLTREALDVGSVHYILATGWGLPMTSFYEKAKVLGWATHEIAGGHDLMLDRPDELTSLLLQIE